MDGVPVLLQVPLGGVVLLAVEAERVLLVGLADGVLLGEGVAGGVLLGEGALGVAPQHVRRQPAPVVELLVAVLAADRPLRLGQREQLGLGRRQQLGLGRRRRRHGAPVAGVESKAL